MVSEITEWLKTSQGTIFQSSRKDNPFTRLKTVLKYNSYLYLDIYKLEIYTHIYIACRLFTWKNKNKFDPFITAHTEICSRRKNET